MASGGVAARTMVAKAKPSAYRTIDLAGVPDGYQAMNDREAIKVMITP
jgi:hypothetical protein